MALQKGDIANFEVLKRAAADGNIALMECKDVKTGEYRAVICAVSHVDGEFALVPFGHMCLGNPYEDYIPPEGGGYWLEVIPHGE